MALFGSKERKTTQFKKVRPTVLRTQNVAKELIAIAKSYDVKIDTIDFNLLEIQTYTRMFDGHTETDWDEISSDALYELDETSELLNAHFQIKQIYEIEVFSKQKDEEDDNILKNFNIAVGANATKCKVYLSVKAGSKLSYHSSLSQELMIAINKVKVRAGVLVGIFDEMLDDVVSKITAKARVDEKIEYEQNETILVAHSYEPTLTQNDALMMRYDDKKEASDVEKVDYASRGFIQDVHKDQLLIEYIKAKPGKPGRNCRGEFMTPKETVVKHEPTFKVNDTIKVVETDASIQYIAREKGYIALEDNTYLIKTEMDIGEISFKTTGSISTGIDSDVSISVSEKDAIKDAIGTGMDVEVTEIDIEGNVGSNAKVRALKATIGGQTHKTAIIKADNLNINVHKGTAFGKHIHITRLEHGNVDGDVVEITQAIGGDIRAKEISIEVCGSYVKATASKRLEIKKLHGSENKFVIDPLLKKDAKKDFANNEDEIVNLEREVRAIGKEIEKYKNLITQNTRAFNDVKKRLIHYKKNGVKMPDSFVKQYKQFQNMQKHLDAITKEQKVKSDQHTLLTTRTASFQDNIVDARIINKDRWIGHNEIIFKLVEPPMELRYVPQENSKEKVFGVVEVDEGQFEIQAITE